MASEQFREVDERFRFLRAQLDDLETATRDLSRIAEQIHAESSSLFRQAFADIRNEFQGMFRRLFGGGRTELKLTDPDALLESGIEFYAQPPGKKLENITLLSGGERALTAVALLFALYRIRPSPFCILDEIDAALDDENVGRLVELLTEFSADTQFLVVTHTSAPRPAPPTCSASPWRSRASRAWSPCGCPPPNASRNANSPPSISAPCYGHGHVHAYLESPRACRIRVIPEPSKLVMAVRVRSGASC